MAHNRPIPAIVFPAGIFSIALALAAASLPLAAQTGSLRHAESLLEKQQYAQAETELQALTTAQASNPQVWFDLGFAASHLGKTADAITAYKKAVALSPSWFEANLNLGATLATNHNLPEAAEVFKKTVLLKPTEGNQQGLGKAWFLLAQVLEDANPKDAADAYTKAAEFDPRNAEIIVGLGNVLQRAGDPAGAEKKFLAAAELGNRSGMEQLINLLTAQKRTTEAETWLREYLAQNPQSVLARIQLGRLLSAEGKKEEAIAQLENTGPSASVEVRRALAGLYLDVGHYDNAAKLFQTLAEAAPADPELQMGLGMALVKQRHYPEAEAALLKAAQGKPSLTDAYFELAYAAQQNQHYQLAIRALDARAKLAPETPATYFLRATAYDHLRSYKQAAENYKLFLANAQGHYPNQEFQARHRLIAIEPK